MLEYVPTMFVLLIGVFIVSISSLLAYKSYRGTLDIWLIQK